MGSFGEGFQGCGALLDCDLGEKEASRSVAVIFLLGDSAVGLDVPLVVEIFKGASAIQSDVGL